MSRFPAAHRALRHRVAVADLLHRLDAEEELLWPLLLERADNPAPVLRAEEQHERLRELARRLQSASGSDADAFAAELRAALDKHLDDEERTVLPLVARHVTAVEWARFVTACGAGPPGDGG